MRFEVAGGKKIYGNALPFGSLIAGRASVFLRFSLATFAASSGREGRDVKSFPSLPLPDNYTRAVRVE